jgi:hypothetical protein
MAYRDDVEALRMLRDRIAGDLDEARRSEQHARQLAQRAAELEDELAEVDERLALQRSRAPRPLQCGRARPLQVVTLIALVHGLLALGAILGRALPMASYEHPSSPVFFDDSHFFPHVLTPPAVAESMTSCSPFYFLDSDGNPRVKPQCLVEVPAAAH